MAPSTTTTVRAFGRRMVGPSQRNSVECPCNLTRQPIHILDADFNPEGTWVVEDQVGSLRLGPEEFSSAWWFNEEQGNEARRDCYFDDEYISTLMARSR